MNATVVSQPINATVSSSGVVSVSVSASQAISSTASGGIGPQGPAGDASGSLDQLSDVVAPSPVEGEVLRYVGGVWRDQPSGVNGGNF